MDQLQIKGNELHFSSSAIESERNKSCGPNLRQEQKRSRRSHLGVGLTISTCQDQDRFTQDRRLKTYRKRRWHAFLYQLGGKNDDI